MEKYLEQNKVKEFPNCVQYATLKACIIGSVNGKLTYWQNDIYCFNGEIENVNYIQKTREITIPLFSPYVNQKI